jgi:pyrroloquinoline quinone biosynthesis protein E
MLTGDAANADPVCSKSAHHGKILQARSDAEAPTETPMTFRNERNSRVFCRSD